MAVVDEGPFDEDEERDDGPRKPKSVTALSILEALAGQSGPAAPLDEAGHDTDSVESLGDSGEHHPIQEDVFELEGIDGVSDFSMIRVMVYERSDSCFASTLQRSTRQGLRELRDSLLCRVDQSNIFPWRIV